MDQDTADMEKEVKEKTILHWNCRGLTEFPRVVREYGRHIREIYLKWNSITTLPPWIMELFNVTNLYIYGNLIKEIPMELGKMSQLTVLDLSSNKISSLSSCIGMLVNLKTLLVNDNSIETLPTELCELRNLEILSISGNSLYALPEWLGSLPKLKELIADGNRLRELPNRLTLAPELSLISVCSNRLRYLPLNGFISSPCIRFDANSSLNYLSYPLLCQLIAKHRESRSARNSRNVLAYGCFQMNRQECSEIKTSNIKISVNMGVFGTTDTDRKCGLIIELPRQLFAIYNVTENKVSSLWELSLRCVYREAYKHNLRITSSQLAVKVDCNRQVKASKFPRDLPDDILTKPETSHFPFHFLLSNGPICICVNADCDEPIFTEAWLMVGINRSSYSIMTIALFCSRRCASEFVRNEGSSVINLCWQCIN